MRTHQEEWTSLLVLDRLRESQVPAVGTSQMRAVIQAAFGQRRKTLANCLAAGLSLTREQAQDMVATLGLPPDVRAERLEPRQFLELAALV